MEIGKINKLNVLEIVDNGVVLDGGDDVTVFLPQRDKKTEAPQVGDELKVFTYRDAQRDIMASEYLPYAVSGEFEFLTVKKVSQAGALLDWGISKDLFLPSREQTTKLFVDRSYLVYVYYDPNTQQVIATMNLDDHLGLVEPTVKMNDEVEILVARETEIGYRVIVNDSFWGIIYHSEIFEKVYYGMRTKGYVKSVREDRRIDIALQKQGYKVVDSLCTLILEELERNQGFLPYNDDTESDVIYNKFGCSKKSFKKTIGTLFRQQEISIDNDGIRLVK